MKMSIMQMISKAGWTCSWLHCLRSANMLPVLPCSSGIAESFPSPPTTENNSSASTPIYQSQTPPVSPAFHTSWFWQEASQCLRGIFALVLSEPGSCKNHLPLKLLPHITVCGKKVPNSRGFFLQDQSKQSQTQYNWKALIRPAATWVVPTKQIMLVPEKYFSYREHNPTIQVEAFKWD